MVNCEISLEQLVTLCALMLTSEKIDESNFGPLNTLGSPFSPNYEFGYELIKRLIISRIIKPKQPKYQSFTTLSKNGEEPTYEKVNWEILTNEFDAHLNDITTNGIKSVSILKWEGEFSRLKQKLAAAECREFYEYSLDLRNLNFEFNSHTEVLIVNLLRDYSVSQCYQIFWHSAKYTVDFKAINPKIHKSVTSIMNEACLRYVNHSKMNDWLIKGFDRNVNVPRNMINYVLYEIILESEVSGFTSIV